MMCPRALYLIWVISLTLSISANPILPGAQFILARRGSRSEYRESINFTYLEELATVAEGRFQQSMRIVKDNRPTRAWIKNRNMGRHTRQLAADVGRPGSWFARVKIGDPPQELEFDLDMLHPDFFLISTTSIEHFGSQYNSFASRSHAGSETRVHTDCRLPTDLLHLSNTTVSTSLSIQIPMCGRPKYSRRTLGSSGNVLGLAPSNHLAQITHPSLLGLLNGSVPESLWSMTLLDAHSGILSCGTTIALDVEEAKIRTQIELENMDKQGVDATFIEKETQLHLSNFQQQEWRDLFRWSDVRGAAGWWTTLLQGVWVNGAKILKNQPVLFDIQVPFILAPPLAVKRFYASISGSKRIQKPFDRFFAFPCLNQPSIAFEFNAWLYPTMGGEKSESDDYTGLHGGKFSLGKEMPGSGYCVGLVVETSMGLIQDMYSNDGQFGKRKVIVRNDLRDFWVLGEPFFRGMGLVLDVEKQKIGFRSY